MSLGNDPARVPDRDVPEPDECRHCDRRTHDPQRVCPDCRYELELLNANRKPWGVPR